MTPNERQRDRENEMDLKETKEAKTRTNQVLNPNLEFASE